MNERYRKWFEGTRKSSCETIAETETIFEGLVLKIASGAMAISFSFITALAPKMDYRHLWLLAIGWLALAACVILNILSHLRAKRNCQRNILDIDRVLWNPGSDEEQYANIRKISDAIHRRNRKLDNRYNRPTAWLTIGGIVFILLFVLLNLNSRS